jgi:choline dehydrogenase-like flavoprotein
METQNYDIIIIGAGAGGGMLASYLAPSGKKSWLSTKGHGCRAKSATGM